MGGRKCHVDICQQAKTTKTLHWTRGVKGTRKMSPMKEKEATGRLLNMSGLSENHSFIR